MKIYKKGDPEYISNGEYEISGVKYLSVYTFKKQFRPDLPNNNDCNDIESTKIHGEGVQYLECETDISEKYITARLFPEANLITFYSINF